MSKVKTLDELKKIFVENGYTILIDDFYGCDAKVPCVCPKGHFCALSYNSLRCGWGCSICGIERSSKLRRNSIEKIKNVLGEFGYKLITKDYKNNKQYLDMECPKEHRVRMSFTQFSTYGRRCFMCSKEKKKKRKRYTLEDVKKIFSDRGFTLVSKEYKRSKDKLDYICPNGHIGSVNLMNFKRGVGCPICHKNKRLTIDEVRGIFSSSGYTLLTNKYENNKQKVKYMCPKGHIGYVRVDNFKHGYSCLECSYELRSENARHGFDKVRKDFSEEGYELLSKHYIGVDDRVLLLCPNGHKFTTTYHGFMGSGYRCWCVSGGKGTSKISQEWLDRLGVSEEYREHYFKGLMGVRGPRVDAYDPGTNTIYEFLGDYWHGNPVLYNMEGENLVICQSYKELYEETKDRINLFESFGYNVIYVWENDFKNGKLRSFGL